MPLYRRHKHRAEGPRRKQFNAGLTAFGTAAAVVTLVLVVTGSVLTPGGALSGKMLRHWRPTRHHTWTATTHPRPTHTTSPTKSPTTHPTTAPTTHPTTAPTTGPTTHPTTPTTGPTTGTTGGTGNAAAGIGVYMSGNNSGLDSYTASWRVKPNVASFYLNWNSKVPTLMKTYAAQGREIQASLSTKISANSYVRWTDVSKGTYDTQLISLIKSLDALNTRVMLSLDVEPDGYYDSGSGVAQGQTPAQYVAAANHLADLIHANAKNVQSLVWLAGWRDAATEASFLPSKSKIDNISWDPYMTGSYSSSTTATQIFSKFIDNVLVPYGYGSIPRHISETGIKTDASSSGTTFSTQTQINYYNSIPAAMSAEDIQSVVWFRANSGNHNYIPTSQTVDQAFASMVQQLLG
ncbi:MAG: hypothetical protein QM747_12685 [Nocardioides sp.]